MQNLALQYNFIPCEWLNVWQTEETYLIFDYLDKYAMISIYISRISNEFWAIYLWRMIQLCVSNYSNVIAINGFYNRIRTWTRAISHISVELNIYLRSLYVQMYVSACLWNKPILLIYSYSNFGPPCPIRAPYRT